MVQSEKRMIYLTFTTHDSEEPVSTHTDKGINIDVNAGTSVLTRGTTARFPWF